MAEFKLAAQKRDVVGKKVSRLRNDGFVPGAVYGPKTEPTRLKFKYRELELALMHAGGTNVIDLNVEGAQTVPVLAREVQRDIIKGDILHVDFFALDMKAKIRAEVPVHYVGESPLVASRKAILLTGPNSLTIEVLASDLMNQIEVDLTGLAEMGDTITVADLKLGDDVTIINDPEEMIAKVVQPSAARAESDLAAAEGEEGLEGGEEGEEAAEEEGEEE
ncbi:50S ribosomal protein L25 [Phototrophicus methaneseepsis]|uniref:Large ribosomal subunit protein bL25 n=1 Tax=Phototrophicus methaneseepsis TaxID=2710758 RepID=A0A7S8E749_9CHLR|nr:50S ribosomal protein L25 [Phototrophicus methaneseepsis]QPC81581.1 50S ribosomal protein L25 [Phototrophicus methaneseepsis]